MEDEDQVREVYARFGLAVYYAQILEHGVVKLTMGRLFAGLRSVTSVPDQLDEQLRKALKKRNWLAHAFFRDRAEQFMTPEGRDMMLIELDECIDLFERTDGLLGQTVDPARRAAGLTDEMVEQAYEAFRTSRHGG